MGTFLYNDLGKEVWYIVETLSVVVCNSNRSQNQPARFEAKQNRSWWKRKWKTLGDVGVLKIDVANWWQTRSNIFVSPVCDNVLYQRDSWTWPSGVGSVHVKALDMQLTISKTNCWYLIIAWYPRNCGFAFENNVLDLTAPQPLRLRSPSARPQILNPRLCSARGKALRVRASHSPLQAVRCRHPAKRPHFPPATTLFYIQQTSTLPKTIINPNIWNSNYNHKAVGGLGVCPRICWWSDGVRSIHNNCGQRFW